MISVNIIFVCLPRYAAGTDFKRFNELYSGLILLLLTLNVSKYFKADIIDRDGSYTTLTPSETLDSFKCAFIGLSQDQKYISDIYVEF
jgi:hypothetical protein